MSLEEFSPFGIQSGSSSSIHLNGNTLYVTGSGALSSSAAFNGIPPLYPRDVTDGIVISINYLNYNLNWWRYYGAEGLDSLLDSTSDLNGNLLLVVSTPFMK